jgi:hypothetical protein
VVGWFTGDPEQLVRLFDVPADANLTAARTDLAVRAPAARVISDAATNDFGFYKKFGYYSDAGAVGAATQDASRVCALFRATKRQSFVGLLSRCRHGC